MGQPPGLTPGPPDEVGGSAYSAGLTTRNETHGVSHLSDRLQIGRAMERYLYGKWRGRCGRGCAE